MTQKVPFYVHLKNKRKILGETEWIVYDHATRYSYFENHDMVWSYKLNCTKVFKYNSHSKCYNVKMLVMYTKYLLSTNW